ncbi:PRTRC system protein F [Burkholderia multivorans]|uniref:PRTRC system protein F n=1 Tax=Burkholderia multivorans TaxID=87883 RepID=UPI0020A4CB40|nr:PRTRC system protein F [Burkholderia multivorans]
MKWRDDVQLSDLVRKHFQYGPLRAGDVRDPADAGDAFQQAFYAWVGRQYGKFSRLQFVPRLFDAHAVRDVLDCLDNGNNDDDPTPLFFGFGLEDEWVYSLEGAIETLRSTHPSLFRTVMAALYRASSRTMFIRLPDWFMYTSQGPQLSLSGGVNGRHEVHVAYALFQDRPIPESVLADYRGNAKHFKYDLQWFPVLLDIPVLRNPLPYNAMQSAVAIFRHENQPIDAELGERIVEALRTAPADSTYVDVDDRLFAAGLVAKPDLPERYQQSVDVGTARSPVAERLRELIGDAVLKKSLDRLDAERRQGRISQRRYSLQVEMAKLDRGRTTFERPNQFAAVVEARDVAALLKVLDQPAGSNDQSKQVLREQFGLSLRGLNSAGRQRVIFAFCGYDEAAQAEWEAKQDAARVQRLAEEAANDAKEQAGRARYRRRDNVVISGVEHVDQAIAEGYSEIRTFRRGAATRYVLAKPGSTEGRTLHAKNGTLEYARSRLTSPAA